MRDVLKQLAANENNVKWNTIIKREDNLYSRGKIEYAKKHRSAY